MIKRVHTLSRVLIGVLLLLLASSARGQAPLAVRAGDRVEVNRGDVYYKGTVQSASRYSVRVVLDVDGNVFSARPEQLRALDEKTSTAVGKPVAKKSGYTATYKRGDKVWIDVEGKGKRYGEIFDNLRVEDLGYYRVNYRGNTIEVTAPRVLGPFNAAELKHKVGDKVAVKGPWTTGTITAFVNSGFTVKPDDPKEQVLVEIADDDLFPAWPYRQLFEIVAKIEINENSHYLPMVAKTVCGQACSPTERAAGWSTLAAGETAKQRVEKLEKAVASFKDFPDNGEPTYDRNPAKVKQIIDKKNDLMRLIQASLLEGGVASWWNGLPIRDLAESDAMMKDAKGKQVFWASYALCGDLQELRGLMKKNLEKAISKYGVQRTADSYLGDFDAKAAKIKADLEAKANDNGWVSAYSRPETERGVVEKSFGGGSTKMLAAGDYEVVREVLRSNKRLLQVTHRTRNGVVVYKRPGCKYLQVITYLLTQPYQGGGFGRTELMVVDEAYKAPW